MAITRIRLAAVVGLAVALAAIGGCGGGGKANSGKTRVDIGEFKFKPAVIDVKLGETVTWKNFDRAQHTATVMEGSAFQFDTGTLRRGEERRVKFTRKGTFAYSCSFHPFMEGKVEVK